MKNNYFYKRRVVHFGVNEEFLYDYSKTMDFSEFVKDCLRFQLIVQRVLNLYEVPSFLDEDDDK